MSSQPSILAEITPHARVLTFALEPGADPRPALVRIAKLIEGWQVVVGLGAPLVALLGAKIEGLRSFPALTGVGVAFPSTQAALWVSLTGSDRGEILDRALAFGKALGEGFRLEEEVDCFKYRKGHDLTGFEDGTENPKDQLAIEAAIVSGKGPGLDGSSFVAVQRYKHDLIRFEALDVHARGNVIGRSFESNEELEEAAASAHVKRSAQESFDPPAFMVRRSMPWGGAGEHGLYFVAYSESLDRFERVLSRMAGRDDGVVDALLSFTRALSGGYYWCPPLHEGRLDLRALDTR